VEKYFKIPDTPPGSGQELMANVALLKLEYFGYVGQHAVITVLKGTQYQTKSIRQCQTKSVTVKRSLQTVCAWHRPVVTRGM